MTFQEKKENRESDNQSKKKTFLMIFINVFFMLVANVVHLSIVHLLLLFLISYFIFLFYSYKSLGNLRNLFLSAEFIFVSVFFIYAVPNAFIYVLDGYVPRISYFFIDYSTVFKTLLLYFNIYTVLLLTIMFTGGVHSLKYDESKFKNKKTLISFDLFDLIAFVLTAYFYYLNFRNGFSIFGQFFQDLRQNIQSSVHNLNNYMYLYMIIYCYINLYKIVYKDRTKQKFTYKELFFLIILVAFWSLSLLTDRRNLFTLIIFLVFLFFDKLKKINFKKLLILGLCIISLMSMSYFRSGTNRRDINNVLFLSLGEFIFVNYVSEYYINNCEDLYYGRTYVFDTMVSVIPRRFYPNKPETLSVKFWREAKTNVGYAFNPVAEGLINFGVKGAVLIVPFVILFFIKMAYWFSKKNFLYYFIICGESINFYRGTFSSTIFTLVVMIVLAKLMLFNNKINNKLD